MGFCTRRRLFLTLCVLQMITVIERQAFDFLGFLWIPILVNFFQVIFIIFGFFGAYQYRPKYVISYLLWHLFWIGWNVFLICLYLNVPGLDRDTNKVLKLDQTSDSWWKKNGPGCKVANIEESKYEGCLINYIHVEIVHSGLQIILAVLTSFIGICLSRTFLEEDDTFNFEKGDDPHNILLRPMYVSYNDNLHGSNRQLPTKSKNQPDFEYHSSHNSVFARLPKTNYRRVRADAVRMPFRRSSSFDQLSVGDKRDMFRPKSLYSTNYEFVV